MNVPSMLTLACLLLPFCLFVIAGVMCVLQDWTGK
jgi:hypothetical protein